MIEFTDDELEYWNNKTDFVSHSKKITMDYNTCEYSIGVSLVEGDDPDKAKEYCRLEVNRFLQYELNKSGTRFYTMKPNKG